MLFLKNRQQRISLLPVQSPSPVSVIDRTYTDIFFFKPNTSIKKKLQRYYQNPIYVAKEYKRMIESGEVKNQSELARKLDVSRVRICQVLSLLKLDIEIIGAIEKLGDSMPKCYISEHKLRSLLKLSNERHRTIIKSIILKKDVMPHRLIRCIEGLLILVSLHTAMEEEILMGEECLSLFSEIPCDTIINLNYCQNIMDRVACL
jgi:hypothetical protein